MIESLIGGLNTGAKYIIPLLLVGIPFYALTVKKIMDYEVFVEGAKAGKHEQNPLVDTEFDPSINLVEKDNAFYLHITLNTAWARRQSRQLVTTDLLGRAKIPNLPYEEPDGSPYRIGADYFGKKRNPSNPFPGPFELTESEELVLKVWPL